MRQRIKLIIGHVDCKESDVIAALCSITVDNAPNVIKNDFEAAEAFILPTDLVRKKYKRRAQ